jgi:hypothetical protein
LNEFDSCHRKNELSPIYLEGICNKVKSVFGTGTPSHPLTRHDKVMLKSALDNTGIPAKQLQTASRKSKEDGYRKSNQFEEGYTTSISNLQLGFSSSIV